MAGARFPITLLQVVPQSKLSNALQGYVDIDGPSS
jgi:hypothetical protein